MACQDLAYETSRERPKSQFNLVIRPEIRFVQLQIDHEPISWQDERTYQENPTVVAVGVALDWLPSLKGQRWALTLEPTFQSIQIESRAALGKTCSFLSPIGPASAITSRPSWG